MSQTEPQLGQKVQDSISGFTGIVTTVGDHISGCNRYGVRPVGDEETVQRGDQEFFYADQLEILDDDTEFSEAGEESYVDTNIELGNRVMDRVTGFQGTVSVINYKLWNCPQVLVQPNANDDGSLDDAEWFDVVRLAEREGNVEYDFWDGEDVDEQDASSTGAVSDSRSRNESRY